jgi:hypothetical protein
VFEFATPFKVNAFRQFDLLGDHALCFVDEPNNITAADIERHVIQ